MLFAQFQGSLVAARGLSRTAQGSRALLSFRAKLSASLSGSVWFCVFNYALKLSQVWKLPNTRMAWCWGQPGCKTHVPRAWLSAEGVECAKLGPLPAYFGDCVCDMALKLDEQCRKGTAPSRCHCFPVLPGRFCEENVDDCISDSGVPRCFNGGQCIDQIGGYSCLCPQGFAGERCEGDINECLSNPCNPRGSLDCVQLTNDYRCICRSAFTGECSWTRFHFHSSTLGNGASFPSWQWCYLATSLHNAWLFPYNVFQFLNQSFF